MPPYLALMRTFDTTSVTARPQLVDVFVPPAVYAECRPTLQAAFVVVEGVLLRTGPVLSLVAANLTALEDR